VRFDLFKRLLRGGVTLRRACALRHLVEAAGLFGLRAHPFDFRLQVCVGLGPDAGDFRFECDRGSLLGRLPCLFGRDFAKPLDFLLRFLLSEPCFGGLLAQSLELGDQIRIGICLGACELGLELACGRFLGCLVRLSIAIDVAREIRGPSCLLGLGAKTREFGVEFGVSVCPYACHFGFELVGGGRLRRHARFLRGELAQGFGFELGLRLCEPCLGSLLA
jgi:hypothetical protein